MVAIATDPLKRQFTNLLLSEVESITDSNEYYIGIGKSDVWDSSDTVVTPLRTLKEEREARNNLQAVKKVTASSFVIPRYNWSSGTIYSSWSDASVGIPTNSYYVLTEDNEVYICLQQGKNAAGVVNASTVKPSYTAAGVSEVRAFTTADGYIWKFLYPIATSNATNFLSSNFVPVEDITIDSASANLFQLQQLNIQNTAVGGQILGVEIVSGGSGYSSAPTITFNGDGTGAAATATISGGVVVKVEMNNDSAAFGKGYNFAGAKVSSGTAQLRPIIGPSIGIGKSATRDLKSSSVMFNMKPDGAEGGNFQITNDFRQIVLMKNLDYTDSASSGGRFTGASSKVGRFMTLTGTIAASGLVVDELITGGTSGTTAYVTELDSSSGNIVYFHQNLNNVAGKFTDGESITGNGVGSATIDSGDKYNAVDQFSGDVLYIENRASVVRSASQTEDIKVIITV